MPAFSFEKITPPVHHGPVAPVGQKQRGVIVQFLGRLVESRVRRVPKQDKTAIAHREPAASE
ncbi:hypothetical protein AS156_26630 [Bradyrhizobium macuxiense]|uniref:Uncharacterized protein n=1 Tax=Bradyrhizobium macuxiense TaxID=1755647 RepID=A0A109K525_9BRAD|nr:hypothetical protein [Bradyrhizobium macuxiense]KWV60986.1 hypothetical protein AS156_26630 [Bradyrhizobium macuxiense]